MQLSSDIHNILNKKPIKPEDCKLGWTFTVDTYGQVEQEPEEEFAFVVEHPDGRVTRETPPKPLTAEDIASIQQQIWLARVKRGSPKDRPHD